MTSWPRRAGSFLLLLGLALLAWEGYKLLGAATGGSIPFTGVELPVRSDDRSMPHLWDIVGALFRPVRRGGEEVLLSILLQAALFTWRSALVGFVAGSVIGFLLGVVFVHSRPLERGLMPYVVASQTVPIIAIAPMVVIWGSRLGWPSWRGVAVISAYLTFFPVAINTLRGLRSPQPVALELMRSYASSRWDVLWKLRFPAALPFLFTALKVSATLSVIGAIVGELPAGMAEGLGRALLTFMYYYVSGPEKLYAAVLVSAALGIVFVGSVTLLERLLVPGPREGLGEG
ncbi:MAG: ABC transporter permease [Actinomycetota bacterium]|nr:ABC transporter permease [Actinomycetota bacterium]